MVKSDLAPAHCWVTPRHAVADASEIKAVICKCPVLIHFGDIFGDSEK